MSPRPRVLALLSPLFLMAFLMAPLLSAQRSEMEINPTLARDGASGVCILRVRVDGSADILLQGTDMRFRTRSGRVPVDGGSSCTEPIPQLPLDGFRVKQIAGRGRVLTVENPADRNGYEAWIRIDDDKAGDDLYVLRIQWRLDAALRGSSLKLAPRGDPARWVPEGAQEGAVRLPGTRLSSYDDDPLRYESGQAGQLEFRGQVDGVVDFFIRGDRLHAKVESGQPVKVERFRFTQPLPTRMVLFAKVEKKDGRGSVEIVQEPSAANSYTLVVRVADPAGGSDRYHWVLNWVR